MLLKPAYRKVFRLAALVWLVNITLPLLQLAGVLELPGIIDFARWSVFICLFALLVFHANYMDKHMDLIMAGCCTRCKSNLNQIRPAERDVRCPDCGAMNTRIITPKEQEEIAKQAE